VVDSKNRKLIPNPEHGDKQMSEHYRMRGNAFAKIYFDLETGKYLSAYCTALGISSHKIYFADDTWKNFDLLKPVFDRRFAEWKNKRA
jgi:hypothetical protein